MIYVTSRLRVYTCTVYSVPCHHDDKRYVYTHATRRVQYRRRTERRRPPLPSHTQNLRSRGKFDEPFKRFRDWFDTSTDTVINVIYSLSLAIRTVFVSTLMRSVSIRTAKLLWPNFTIIFSPDNIKSFRPWFHVYCFRKPCVKYCCLIRAIIFMDRRTQSYSTVDALVRQTSF